MKLQNDYQEVRQKAMISNIISIILQDIEQPSYQCGKENKRCKVFQILSLLAHDSSTKISKLSNELFLKNIERRLQQIER